MEIPGSQIEKAAADVATDAGKTLIGALRRRANAWTAIASAKDEANAEEIKRDIKHKGDLRRAKESAVERREQDKLDAEHLLAIRARGFGRTIEEIDKSQASVETVARKAIVYAQREDASAARDINDDWLRVFFKYAADVNEDEVLDILAKALADAAVKGRTILSPKALDTLRFFEGHTFEMFNFACREISMFGSLPTHVLGSKAKEEKIEFDPIQMIELGLIKQINSKFSVFRIADVSITFSYDISEKYDFSLHKLTIVGNSISTLINRKYGAINTDNYQTIPDPRESYMQFDIGLNEGRVRRLAYSILSEIMDNGYTQINARIQHEGRNKEIFSKLKHGPEEPFELENLLKAWEYSRDTRCLLEVFVSEFQHFDKYQLPLLNMKD